MKLKEFFQDDQQDDQQSLDDELIDNNDKNEMHKYKIIKKKENKNELIKQEIKKYKGKTISYDKLNKFDEEQEEYENEPEELSLVNRKKVQRDYETEEITLKEKKKENSQSKLIDDQLDKEDEEYLKKISQHTPNEIRKGKNVSNQKKLFEFFIGIRISLQKILGFINSLPQGSLLDKFIDSSNIHILKDTTLDIFTVLESILKLQKELSDKSYLSTPGETISNEISNLVKFISKLKTELTHPIDKNSVDEIFKMISPIYNKISINSEKIFNIWYRKTLVYSHVSNNKILKILNNNFCEHIKTSIDSNYDNIRRKSMKKQVGQKILGKGGKDVLEEYDDEIYNDYDFYNFLLKEFISSKEDIIANESVDNYNSRIDLTLQYIMNRNKDKKSTNKDKKASKNRKIKYDKHEKLINFMVPVHNSKLNTGRNEILNSLLGAKKKKETEDEYDSDFNII